LSAQVETGIDSNPLVAGHHGPRMAKVVASVGRSPQQWPPESGEYESEFDTSRHRFALLQPVIARTERRMLVANLVCFKRIRCTSSRRPSSA
jgi:hypothetical protein